MEKITINLEEDGNILVVDNDNNTIKLDNERKIKFFFDEIASYGINKKYYDDEKDLLTIENNKGIICINNYLELREEDYFNNITEKIANYNKKKGAHAKLVRNFILAPVATIGLTAGVVATCNISSKNPKEVIDNNTITDDTYSTTTSNKTYTININDQDDEIIYDEEIFIDESAINDEKNYDEIVVFDDKDPLSYADSYDDPILYSVEYASKEDNDDSKNVEPLITKEEQIIPIETTKIDIKPSDSTVIKNSDISQLEQVLDNYNDIISTAAKVYNIDYETARQVIIKYQDCITGPKGNVSMYMPYSNAKEMIKSDVDRIKDLSEKGFINPDIINSGIYLAISNYAYSIDSVGKNIKECNLTREEREKFILYLAENVYGVTDDNLKAVLLAATWIESHTGESEVGKNRNNIGGNTGANGLMKFDNFYQGASEYVYNMLKVIDRTFYNEEFTQSNDLIYKIGYIYNQEEWQRWGNEVSKEALHYLEIGKISSLEENNENLRR